MWQDPRQMLSDKELIIRKGTVGSSDVPGIVGSSPWSTRAQVLEKKLDSRRIEKESQFLIGHKLEKPVAELAIELGLIEEKVLFPGWTVRDKEGFASATPDFFALKDGNMTYQRRKPLPEAEATMLEVKVVGWRVLGHWDWGKKVAPYVVDQVLWQMMVCGHQKVKVVSLLGGSEVKVFDVERDEVRLAFLVAECRKFWVEVLHANDHADLESRVLLERLRGKMRKAA